MKGNILHSRYAILESTKRAAASGRERECKNMAVKIGKFFSGLAVMILIMAMLYLSIG